jgi:phenol 2-monooxygenase
MDAEGISMGEFKEAFEKGNMFASGIGIRRICNNKVPPLIVPTAVDYGASNIVAKAGSSEDQGDGTDVSVSSKYRVESDQSLAKGILVGKRMPSAKVLNQSDARPWHFQELLPSNGRWRVVVLAGDIRQPGQRKKLDAVGWAIGKEDSFLRRFTPPGSAFDSIFEILAVHSAPRTETTIFDFPEVFRHYDDVDGYDYWKIFADDISYHEGHGKFYETFDVSPEGCILICRPDQYVSYVGPMDDVDAVNSFFSGFMLSRLKVGKGVTCDGFAPNGSGAGLETTDLRVL